MRKCEQCVSMYFSEFISSLIFFNLFVFAIQLHAHCRCAKGNVPSLLFLFHNIFAYLFVVLSFHTNCSCLHVYESKGNRCVVPFLWQCEWIRDVSEKIASLVNICDVSMYLFFCLALFSTTQITIRYTHKHTHQLVILCDSVFFSKFMEMYYGSKHDIQMSKKCKSMVL